VGVEGGDDEDEGIEEMEGDEEKEEENDEEGEVDAVLSVVMTSLSSPCLRGSGRSLHRHPHRGARQHPRPRFSSRWTVRVERQRQVEEECAVIVLEPTEGAEKKTWKKKAET